MSSETPGGGSSGSSNFPIPTMSLRSISDEITIYEITAPIPSKPTLKPLNFEMELFKGPQTKLSPHKLSPLNSSDQNAKILRPSFSILSPKRESQSPSDCQQPQFIHSPSSQNVLLIPSKPELTVTLVSSNPTSTDQFQTILPTLATPSPSISPPEEPMKEGQAEVGDSSPIELDSSGEKLGVGRRKRRKREFAPLLQKTMYRTRTVVKASLAAQIEKEELAEQKIKKEVPLVVPPVSLISNPGSSRGRKRNQRKLSTAEQLEQTRKEGSIDLESPSSILKLLNIKTILSRHHFARIPPLYQFKLLQLLPDVDSISEKGGPIQPSEDAFDNLFYNKACEDWKAKLIAGDFTPEQKQRQRLEADKDKLKVDPWKMKHFEPIWGETYNKRRNMRKNFEASKTMASSTVTTPDPESLTKIEVTSSSPPYGKERLEELQSDLVTDSPVDKEAEELPVACEVDESCERRVFVIAESEEDDKVVVPPDTSPSTPSPGKRDSGHLREEVPVLQKRIRILPPLIPSQQTGNQVSFEKAQEEVSVERQEDVKVKVTEGSPHLSQIPEVDEEETLLLCKSNEIPILLEVDNEVTVENSPFPRLTESPQPLPIDNTFSEAEEIPQLMLMEQENSPHEEVSQMDEFTEESMEIREENLEEQEVVCEEIAEMLNLAPDWQLESTVEIISEESHLVLEQKQNVEDNVASESPITTLKSEALSFELNSFEIASTVPIIEMKSIGIAPEAPVFEPRIFHEKISSAMELRQNDEQKVPLEASSFELKTNYELKTLEASLVQTNENHEQRIAAEFPPVIEKSLVSEGKTNFEASLVELKPIEELKLVSQENQIVDATVPTTFSVSMVPGIGTISIPTRRLTNISIPTLSGIVPNAPNSNPPNTIHLSPLLTPTPLRVPFTTQQMENTSMSRPGQVVLRMISLPTSQQSQTAGIRMGPPQQPTPPPVIPTTPLLPLVFKTEARNLAPRVVGTEYMSTPLQQPRPIVTLPTSVSQIPRLGSVQIPVTTGSTTNPSSPGNVKGPRLSSVPPGSVNLDRSYQICNAVIQNSPNREQLQKQLVKPPPLTATNNNVNRTLIQPDAQVVSGDNSTGMMPIIRRSSTPTVIQTTTGQMPLLSGVPQQTKLMMVPQGSGMVPLLRPVQQGLGLNQQIVVSSPNTTANSLGTRPLGMNLTFTKHHHPPQTNNHPSPPAPTIITSQQLALLLHQQSTNHQRPVQNLTLPHGPQTIQPQRLYISRQQFPATPPHQHQQIKILNPATNSTGFHQINQHSRLPAQILQFQQQRAPHGQVENGQFPLRAQILTPNGETLTIHRATGQPMRVTGPIRPSFHQAFVEQGKRRGSPSPTTSTMTILNRTNFPDNVVHSLLGNNGLTGNNSTTSPPPTTMLSPVSNLADFITSQLAASNIRPISPLAYEPLQSGAQRVGNSEGNSNSSTLYSSNHVPTSHTVLTPTLSLSELSNSNSSSEPILDLQHALGEGISFSSMLETSNHSQPDFVQTDQQRENSNGEPIPSLPPPLLQAANNVPSSNNSPTNYVPINSNKRQDGTVLVQNQRIESPLGGGDGVRQQQFFIVHTTGSNGMTQNLVLPASLLMPQAQELKEEGKCIEGGPPRASSAPPTNQTTMLMNQSQQQHHQPNIQLQENKHLTLPLNFQDFSGIRVLYKNESGRQDEVMSGVEYCVTSAPSSYTLTPVSSGGNSGVVRLVNRTTPTTSELWNYSAPSNGHIVNVNLNGSSGSARIIPGQHPVISIPDTTNGNSSSGGAEFDLFSAIASGTGESSQIKLESNGEGRSVLFPVAITNNNRQGFGGHGSGQGVVLGSSPGNGNCPCDLRAMMVCRKCGAYCHDDCMSGNGTELCMTCMIR